MSGNFLTETWSQRVSFDLEAAGPKPVLVCVRLLLCESHWKKVLSGRIPQARHAMQQVQAMAWTSAVGGLVSKYPGF